MRPSPRLSLTAIPSGLSARQLRRVEDFAGEAVSASPTYEDWHRVRREPKHEPAAARGGGSIQLTPILAAFLAVLLGSMCLVGLKEQIVRVLPASGALYAAAGLPVNLRGLEFRAVTSDVSQDKVAPHPQSARRNRQFASRLKPHPADRSHGARRRRSPALSLDGFGSEGEARPQRDDRLRDASCRAARSRTGRQAALRPGKLILHRR